MIAHIQLRVGPRRVGPHGLLQPLADVIKLLTKEDMLPSHVNKFFYFLAPFIAVFFALIAISVIPFGPEINVGGVKTSMQLTDLNIGVLFILGLSGMGVYGVALAGWASNNKYALLGGLRSSAQMISYELPMAMAIAAPLLMLNTLSFRQLVDAQSGFYFGLHSALDHLPGAVSADRQLHPVYHRGLRRNQSRAVRSAGSRKRTGRRIPHRILQHEVRGVLHGRIRQHGDGLLRRDAAVPGRLAAAVPGRIRLEIPADADLRHRRSDLPVSRRESRAAVRPDHAAGIRHRVPRARGLFLVPILAPILLPLFWFASKVGVILFLYIWIRGTLPRFRYDQLMRFAWTFMFPVAVVNLFITGLLVALN